MKSKAQIKGHPIHPMLVAFPIAFLYGALGFDAAGRLADWPGGWSTGAYLSLAAIASGVIAGVPGLIDYLYAVPPNSSGRARATKHMIVNLAALAAFAAGWAFRDRETLLPGAGTLLLEAVGVGLVTWGGWMGGTLVYRNQIGVDHRFAHAGKWHEEAIEGSPGEAVTIDGVAAMKPGQMWLLRWGDRRLVLARTDDGFAAFDDHCSHRGGSLAGGALVCGVVQCPWHGSQFDVRDGRVKAGPAEESIDTYAAELQGDQVRLTLPHQAPSPPR